MSSTNQVDGGEGWELSDRRGTALDGIAPSPGVALRARAGLVFIADGEVVEGGTPEHFFQAPQEERTKLFLSQIL